MAILEAVEDGDVATARSLLEDNPHLLNADAGGGGWLHAGVDYPEMLTMLLELGCNPEMTWSLGKHEITPAMTAIGEDRPESLEILLRHGARRPPNKELLTAVVGDKRHSLELIRLLHQYGADLHEVFVIEATGKRENVLSFAIAFHRDDVVAYLESQGCVRP